MTAFRSAAFILVTLTGMTGFGQQALGQTGGGQSGHSTSGELRNVKVLRDLDTFGRCLASTDRKSSLALIATKPGSKEEDDAFRKFTRLDQVCLFGGTQMYGSVIYIRGAIAEGLLEAGGVPPHLLLPAPSPAQVTSLSEAARCYTAGHRAEVQALMKMNAGTKQEVAAVGALWPGLKACLPPRANVRLNALWIRFLLAEALLRLSPTAAAPAEAK
jgi:hypothetical protein